MLQSIAARRLRCRAGPATAGSVPASSRVPAPATPADGSSDRRSSSWSMSWCGASTRSAAAASSMASGIPSRRRQIVAARIAFVGVASISGRLTRARARNSSTAGLRVRTSRSVSSSGGHRQRLDPDDALARDADRDPARREDRQAGRPGEEVGEGRRGRAHVLDGVEDEDAGRASERLGEALHDGPAGLLGDAHGTGDRRQDQRWVAHAVERHERDAPVATRHRPARQLDGQPALAHAADAREGDERAVAAQREAPDGRDVGLAPDQRGVGNLGHGTGQHGSTARTAAPAARRQVTGLIGGCIGSREYDAARVVHGIGDTAP